ncbi:hypothetical protein HHS34_008665 [Acidithiobacillus montserratensis]|uniref:Uncharacterized protein n=1 Tax=Acidithiobacillus montserratensis TaxID=2729135 RepID=A0ACD5HD21_9PROT|nr:hypothetical protein [Acidithiobacillus montserratensis]MBN2679711.1 hypothetical protein [Acidithiobacillaceae bacterium]MBU2748095.1 hypothetical protein [Acidithiobacillus montserratensis]
MSIPRKLQERLQFLARVIDRETLHLRSTDQRLFASGFTVEDARRLEDNPELAEMVDAFVSRFGRLQDTVGDKLLPAWRSAVGEEPATMTDNLDRAERLGLIESADLWLTLRQLRNQMIHDYIEDPTVLTNALQTAHAHLHLLTDAAHALLSDLARRGLISRP